MTEGSQLIRGLEGVVAVETRLCDLDGANGRLAYCGYDIGELARQASFEEVCYLLWHGELPKPAELDRFTLELIAAREIPESLIQAFALMPSRTDPNRVLQAAVAMLGMHDPDADHNSRAATPPNAPPRAARAPGSRARSRRRSARITVCARGRSPSSLRATSRTRRTSSTC